MCLEDVRLGRKTYYSTRTVSVPDGVSTVLCPSVSTRVSISIRLGSNQDVKVLPTQGGNVVTDGILLTLSGHPIEWQIDRHGNAVTAAWYASGSGGAGTVIVTETFLEEK